MTYGIKVVIYTRYSSENQREEGIILESLLEGMAEHYSAKLSEKAIRRQTENTWKCKYNGGTPAFDYTIDSDRHYQNDQRTAPVVLEIFTHYDNDTTMKERRYGIISMTSV